MDEVRVPGKSLDLPGNRKVLAEELNWLRKRGSEIEKRRVRKGSSAFGHGKAFVIHPVKEGRGFGKTKGLHIKVHSSSRVTEAQVDSDSEYFDARSLKEIEGFHAENKTEQIITSVQLVGIIAVIVTSGAISLPDVIFVIFASIYSMTLAFVLKTRASQETHEVSGWKTSVFNYLETILGLFLPLVFALGGLFFKLLAVVKVLLAESTVFFGFSGFTRSDSAAVQAATPHVFFVACHLLSKIVVSSTPSCPPAKAFLTIM